MFHRINGYIALTLVIVGNVGGAVVGRAAFGGELNSQSAYYTLGGLIVGCGLMGYFNVKHTRKHRKWMLREFHAFETELPFGTELFVRQELWPS